jgi:DNA mismatch endonuclease (patch repair protein)
MPENQREETGRGSIADGSGSVHSRDRLSPRRRSANMRAIRSMDTTPELLLRRNLWSRGLRYRLRQRIAGARPDLVFCYARVAVFVDGCFWHGCPVHYRPPVGNASYWSAKISGNCARDRRNDNALATDGWAVLRLWECEVRADPAAAGDEVAGVVRSRSGHRRHGTSHR